MRMWPVEALRGTPQRSLEERLAEALEAINYVRAQLDPQDRMDCDLTPENWPEVLTRLYFALHPSPQDWREHRASEEIERAKETGQPYSGIWFDLPEVYSAEEDGRPTETAARRLLEMASWTLTVFSQPNLGGWAPWQAGALLEEHFKRLSRRKALPAAAPSTEQPVAVDIAWHRQMEAGEGWWVPEMIVGAGGIDTQTWRLVLRLLQVHTNVPHVLGKCPECLRLFLKDRKDTQYCGKACSQRARYRRWKERGGLRRRKLRRADQLKKTKRKEA